MNANRWLLAHIAAVLVIVFTQCSVASGIAFPSRLVPLKATTNAPPDATGMAVISPRAGMETPTIGTFPITNGPPTLSVTTGGLLPGTYTVSVTDTATNTYVLGDFTVMTLTNPVVIPNGQGASVLPPMIVLAGGGTFPLPDGLGPGGVVGVFVSDTDDRVDLAGSFAAPVVPPPNPLPEQAVLTPTTNAPPGAVGFATLSAGPWATAIQIVPGTNVPPLLSLITGGLLPGTYSVSVTDTATNAYVLGNFDVILFTNPVPMAAGAVTTPANPLPPISVNLGRGAFPLPAGLDPTSVVGVSVSDLNSLVDLNGTFRPTVLPPPPPAKVIVLAATTNVPPGAMGRAALETGADNTNAATVAVQTRGLLVGSYTVSVAVPTGSNTYTLGTFDVSVQTNIFCRPPSPTALGGTATITAGCGRFALPSGLDPAQVATIAVADSNGVVDLTGDFTRTLPPVPCRFTVSVPLIPGPAAAALCGNARLQILLLNGQTRSKFSLVASGAAANTRLNLLVNGVNIGTVKSNRRGIVTVRRLPKSTDPTSVTTVAGEDGNGNVVFSASF